MGSFEPTPIASALAGQLGPRSFGNGEVEVLCDSATPSDCPLTLFVDEYTFPATESILVGNPSATDYTVEEACVDLMADVRVASARSTGGGGGAPAPAPPPFGDLPELTQSTDTTDMVVSSLVTGLALLKVPGLATLNANWVVLRPSEASTNPNSLWIAMAIALRHGTSPTALTFTDCAGTAQVSILGVGVKYSNVNATKSKQFESFLNDPAGYLWNDSTDSFNNIPTWMASPAALKTYGITIPSRVIYRQETVKWWDSADPTRSLPTVSAGGSLSTCTTAPWGLLDATAIIDPCGSAFANAPDLGEDVFTDNESDCPGEGLSLSGLDNAARPTRSGSIKRPFYHLNSALQLSW